MNISKYPWKTGKKAHNKSVVYDANNNMVADCSIFSSTSTDEVKGANANLIKYAPLMYETLKRVIQFVPEGHAMVGDCKILIDKIENS